MRLLINHGADIEAKDCYGSTPLLCAINAGCELTTLVLLEAGANILATNNLGFDAKRLALRLTDDSAELKLPDSIVSTIVSKVDAGHFSPDYINGIPSRRAEIVLRTNSSSLQLWLESIDAYLEMPPSLPQGVVERHRRTIRLQKCQYLTFCVVYRKSALEFSCLNWGCSSKSVVIELEVYRGSELLHHEWVIGNPQSSLDTVVIDVDTDESA